MRGVEESSGGRSAFLESALFVALVLFFVWLVASYCRSWSAAILCGLIVVGLVLGAESRKRVAGRSFRRILTGSLLTAAGVLLLAEFLLKVVDPACWGPNWGTVVANRYTLGGEGIYTVDESAGLRRMRSSFECPMYFLGYRWRHRTNEQGLRDRDGLERAEGVLLGDSMVYGHGTEREKGLERQLERILGQEVANLAMPASNLLEAYRLMQVTGLSLRPRWAVVMVHGTDGADGGAALTPSCARAFLEAPIEEEIPLDFAMVKAWTGRNFRQRAWLEGSQSRLFRLIDALQARFEGRRVPSITEMQDQGKGQVRLGWQITWRALSKLALLCKRRGIVLIVVDSYLTPVLERELNEVCRPLPLHRLPTGRRLKALAANGKEVFLPVDGHLSPEGHRVLAGWIAGELIRRKLK